MREIHDLGSLNWMLAGWTPYVWRQQRAIESGATHNAEVDALPAHVPGSVQGALRDAGILPDWNVGLNARLYEWVENRHWVYTTHIPDEWLVPDREVRVRALGLDYRGWVLLNGKEVGTFEGTFVPHVFDLTGRLRESDNVLQIVFDTPPRWLGQIGYTSEMTEWKARFNYFWDWTARLVQTGIWDDLTLEITDGEEIMSFDCGTWFATTGGSLAVRATAATSRGAGFRFCLERDGEVLREETVRLHRAAAGVSWVALQVDPWWPNREGDRPLYIAKCELLDADGAVLDVTSRRIGFRSIAWEPCEGAAPNADPWICTINGRPLFLQGVNWTPIRPNFADVTDDDYRRLLQTYKDLGCNALRVWGGAFLEKEIFYDLCDEMGLLVWQEFPLSSSGLENWPPEDLAAIEEMGAIARSYIERRRHHASLTLWCGGNELQDDRYAPVDTSHPLIKRLQEIVAALDPERRFLPASPSGPHFGAEEERFGQGAHWDVHGPWHVKGDVETDWLRYWRNNDGLFHSEVGVAGASSIEIIREFKGELPETPGTHANPLWRRTSWWIEWPKFVDELGREPADLEEYVAWSQERQRRALQIAIGETKGRFPRCGGFLLWMGHDSFPCTANTAIVDFNGNLKPAAETIGRIFRDEQDAEKGAPSSSASP